MVGALASKVYPDSSRICRNCALAGCLGCLDFGYYVAYFDGSK